MKRGLIVLLTAIIILAAAVNADGNFSIQKSYDWIIKQESNGSYGSIIDTSASVMALKAAGYSPTSAVDYLASQENIQHCWPKTSCKTKDTAFVILAYYNMGVGTSEIETWMHNGQSAALQTGNWWLEVATAENGTCTVKYTKNAQEITKTVRVNEGVFTDCGGTTFFNINNCLEANLVKNYPTIKLYVDCSTFSDALISLIYNSANSYYILTESQNKIAEIDIENGCFGIGYKDPSCNYESTLYSNWALKTVGAETTSEMYLRDNYDKTNTIHNALLYIIFEDTKYLDELKTRQRTDGSWDGDVYKTAIALLALKGAPEYSTQFGKGVTWLETKQKADGSFGDVTTTAMVLYSAFTEGEIIFPSCTNGVEDANERGVDCGGVCEEYDDCCTNGIKDSGEEGLDCGGVCEDCPEDVCDNDGTCDTDQGEDCHNCPDDCEACENLCDNGKQDVESGEEGVDCGGECPNECEKKACDNNGICDIDLVETGRAAENENRINCPADCYPGDGVCDEEENYEIAPQDCEAPPVGCGDGVCDPETETEANCAKDCGEPVCNEDGICDTDESCSCADCAETEDCITAAEKGFPWMIVIILLIALLAIVAYVLYTKGKKKKKGPELFGFGKFTPKKPDIKEFKAFGPIKETKPEKKETMIIMPQKKPEGKTKIEQELEKSIKEAKNLLGKK